MSLALALANIVTGHRTYQQIGLPSRRPSTVDDSSPPPAVPTGLSKGRVPPAHKDLSEIDTDRALRANFAVLSLDSGLLTLEARSSASRPCDSLLCSMMNVEETRRRIAD